jgi:hypothetical protein
MNIFPGQIIVRLQKKEKTIITENPHSIEVSFKIKVITTFPNFLISMKEEIIKIMKVS